MLCAAGLLGLTFLPWYTRGDQGWALLEAGAAIRTWDPAQVSTATFTACIVLVQTVLLLLLGLPHALGRAHLAYPIFAVLGCLATGFMAFAAVGTVSPSTAPEMGMGVGFYLTLPLGMALLGTCVAGIVRHH